MIDLDVIRATELPIRKMTPAFELLQVDDEKEKQAEVENLDEEIANLMLEDDFLREYVQRRMEDMLNSAKNL